jgi:diaminopimelate decarboxylase
MPPLLERVLPALRRLEPRARACWVYDLDELAVRALRFRAAFAALDPLTTFALKANGLPAALRRLRDSGVGAEAGSLGELELAAAAGFASGVRVLNGNGRTEEEAVWVARAGVHSVNADHVAELDLLERAAADVPARGGAETSRLRVALRVNPGIATPGHRYVATGGAEAKFGVSPDEALEAWRSRARWPHLVLDGVHVHVGSQLLDPGPLERALESALELAAESARRGAPLGLVNLGGGFGVDYEGRAEFPLEAWASRVVERAGRGEAGAASRFEWVLEPGRWLVAPVGVLLAEVLWVKRRDGRRFVVLAAGMNDLLRPALYGARHRIEPLRPRSGAREPAVVVGPVCESADVFARDVELPPLEPGDVVAVRDAGAYGAAMASNYNGRSRLAEVVVAEGRLARARAGEAAADLSARATDDPLEG